MKRLVVGGIAVCVILILSAASLDAQVHWNVGGRMGMSIVTASYGGVSGTSAGFQIGPAAEVIFSRQFAVCSEFDINTQAGTPVEWANMFKYYFLIPSSKIMPYADGGMSLVFMTGGPYFGLRFGGGALFPVARNLYVPADFQVGPVFVTGTTAFFIEITSGVKYFF